MSENVEGGELPGEKGREGVCCAGLRCPPPLPPELLLLLITSRGAEGGGGCAAAHWPSGWSWACNNQLRAPISSPQGLWARQAASSESFTQQVLNAGRIHYLASAFRCPIACVCS